MTLEVTWSVIPLVLVIVVFWVGFQGYLDMRVPPGQSYDILVTARQWSWEFTYPGGLTSSELHVPADTTVQLVMSSDDVLHAMFIPDFRVKQDVVPGRYSKLWFNAPAAGEHQIFCAEYCGRSHSDMLSKVIVHDGNGYKQWMQDEERIRDSWDPVQLGEFNYKIKCMSCHTVDGTAKIGPSWKGLYGHTVQIKGGPPVEADENYIRESIVDPQAKVVAGFDGVMPSFKGQLTDKAITGIIEYMKTLSQ